MKKIALLVAALCVLSTSSVQAQAITVYNATNGANFTGTALPTGAAVSNTAGTAFISAMQADDITTVGGGGGLVTQFAWTAVNTDAGASSIRNRVRFYAADGAGGNPGTEIGAFSFNPINFTAGQALLISAAVNPAGYFTIPANGRILGWSLLTT